MRRKKNKKISEDAVLILKLLSNRSINDGGTVQFILFLLMTQDNKMARLKKKEYTFFRTSYGPFSESILNNQERLISKKLIAVKSTELKLTQKGRKALKNRWKKISKITEELSTLIDAIAAKYHQKEEGDFVLKIRKAVFKSSEFQRTNLGHYFEFAN